MYMCIHFFNLSITFELEFELLYMEIYGLVNMSDQLPITVWGIIP